MRQRQYWQWKSEQKEPQEETTYYPPHLRELRTEYFAKRYEKYGPKKAAGNTPGQSSQDIALAYDTSETEKLANRIWAWLNREQEEAHEKPCVVEVKDKGIRNT
jgi:hypothetical protein